MKRYAECKDSGIPWIGEIPKDWEVKKLKYLICAYKAGPFGSALILDKLLSDGEIVVYSPEHIIDEDADTYYLPSERLPEMKQFLLAENDIFFPIVGTLGRAKVYSNRMKKGIINQRLAKLSPNLNVIDVDYILLHMCQTVEFRQQLSFLSKGAILEHITKEALLSISFAVPNIEKQKDVLAYLNTKTAAIDTLIADKQKLIDLLKEKRQAIISEAVTKGLDKTAKMKDSGIEWIGEIPEGWEVKRFKYCVRLRNEKANAIDRYIGLENIEPYFGKLVEHEDESLAEGQANMFYHGDVLFGKLRPYLHKGFYAYFDGQCTGELLVFTPMLCDPQFLLYLELSYGFVEWVNSSTYGSKMPRASWDFIGNMSVPLPSIMEQKKVVQHLYSETNRIDALISDIQTQIEKLKEYRRSIISEAVTGKVAI